MKNTIKKLITICIVLLSFGLIVSAHANSISVDDKINILKQLDIISESENNDDFSMERKITRDEFCLYLARALQLNISETKRKLPFSDVGLDEPLAEYITMLYDLGVVSGDGNAFRPKDYISANEAIKMVVSSIGYGNFAEADGGYPTGYLKMASEIELTKGWNPVDYASITKGEGAELIYNMLNAPLMKISFGDNSSIITEKSENVNLLMKLYDISIVKGKVIANEYSSLVSDTKESPKNTVTIKNVEYDVGETDISNMLGYDVEFLCRYDSQLDKYTVLYIINQYNYDETVEIESTNIISFDDGTYTYYDEESGKTKKIKLSKDFYLLYNFSYPTSAFLSDMMIPKNGKIKIVKNYKDVNDMLFIEDYNAYVVESIEKSSEIIYCKDNTVLNLRNAERIISDKGVKITFSDIMKNDVLSIYWNADKTKPTVYVSQNSVVGTIDRRENDNIIIVEINGEEYAVSVDCKNQSLLKYGASVTAFLDNNNKIVYAETSYLDDFRYGYCIKVYMSDIDEDGEEHPEIKLFDIDGSIKKYRITKKVEINGERSRSYLDSFQTLENRQDDVMKFSLNNKGEINKIYLLNPNSNKYINLIHNSGVSTVWNAKQRTFGGITTVETNTPILLIPRNGDYTDYKVKDLGYLVNDRFYDVSVYTTGDNVYGDLILRRASVDPIYERNAAVVTKVVYSLDEFDEPQYSLTLLYGGQERTFITKEEDIAVDISKGDVIKIELDEGRLLSILKVYDCSEDDFLLQNPYEPQTGAGYRSQNRMYMGYVYLCKDGLAKFGKNPPNEGNLSAEGLENALLSSFNIYVIDKNNDEYRVGDESDILDYGHAKDDCSKIIVSTNWGDPEEIIVIK